MPNIKEFVPEKPRLGRSKEKNLLLVGWCAKRGPSAKIEKGRVGSWQGLIE